MNVANQSDIHSSKLAVELEGADARKAKGGVVTTYSQLPAPLSHSIVQDDNFVLTKCSFRGVDVFTMNIYIPVTTREAKDLCDRITYKLHVLLGQKGVKNLIVCGDFNNPGSRILVDWLLGHGFKMANDSQVPTHRKGNILTNASDVYDPGDPFDALKGLDWYIVFSEDVKILQQQVFKKLNERSILRVTRASIDKTPAQVTSEDPYDDGFNDSVEVGISVGSMEEPAERVPNYEES